jgi:hypothetical protein
MKRPKQVPSFVTAYAYEPLPDDPGARLGNLYVAIEVLVSGRASEEVADLVIETIGDRFYNQAQPDQDALQRFEAAIKATNHELGEHVSRGNAAWIGKLSAVVAVQTGPELHIAHTGSAEAFLYRGKAASHISAGGPNRPTTPNKTFGSISSGQLEPGDRLLLATPALIHQVPLTRLQSIISQAGPNAAIAEITEHLKGAAVDRVAGLVIEITTPEQAALQVRSTQPSEIRLGTPENALEAAKLAAAPIAHTTVDSSKKVVHAAHTGIRRAQPHAKAFSLAAVDVLRRLIHSSRNRKRLSIGVIVVILATFGLLSWQSQAKKSAQVYEQYQTVYATFASGQAKLDSGDKTAARSAFSEVTERLEELKSHEKAINKRLANSQLKAGEPKTFAALASLASDRIDQIDGLVKIKPVTVVNFTTKNARVDHFEYRADKVYAFDSGNDNALTIINVLTGSTRPSGAATSKMGAIVATTLSGSQDGIYILTAKPSVWFYRFDTDTVTEQLIAFGQWPKAKAIASYASNLYLLADTAIYRHAKTSTGFSPKTDYLITNDEASRDATALAVDGFVYLLSPSGLHRYAGGSLKQSAPTPEAVGPVTNLRSVDNGEVIIGTGEGSSRVAFWNAKPAAVTFSKQVALEEVTSLFDAVYEPKTGQAYALVDGRLVRFPVQP